MADGERGREFGDKLGERGAHPLQIMHVIPACDVDPTMPRFQGRLHVAICNQDWRKICDLLQDDLASQLFSTQLGQQFFPRLEELFFSNVWGWDCLNTLGAFSQCVTSGVAEAVDLSRIVLGLGIFVADAERCGVMAQQRQYIQRSVLQPLVMVNRPIRLLKERQALLQQLFLSCEGFSFTSCLSKLKEISHANYSAACGILEDGLKNGFDKLCITDPHTTADRLHCYWHWLRATQLQIQDVTLLVRDLDAAMNLSITVLQRVGFYNSFALKIPKEDGYQPLPLDSGVSGSLLLYNRAIQLTEKLHSTVHSRSRNILVVTREQQGLVKRLVDAVQMAQASSPSPGTDKAAHLSQQEDVDISLGFNTSFLTHELVTALERIVAEVHGRKVIAHTSSAQDMPAHENWKTPTIPLVVDSPLAESSTAKQDQDDAKEAYLRNLTYRDDLIKQLQQKCQQELEERVQLQQQLQRQSNCLIEKQECQQLLDKSLQVQEDLNAKIDVLEQELHRKQETIQKQSELMATVRDEFRKYKEAAQKNVTKLENAKYHLQKENTLFRTAKMALEADVSFQKETQKSGRMNSSWKPNGRSKSGLTPEIADLIHNPSRLEQIVRSEQALKLQVAAKEEVARRQEIHLSEVKRELDAMQRRLEDQARRTAEHRGVVETLTDPKRPSQLNHRFDQLYHKASVTVADQLLADTEGRISHDSERRVNEFICRLFMEVIRQVDDVFDDRQKVVMRSLCVSREDASKDKQLCAVLKHCVCSLLSVSRTRNKDKDDVVKRVYDCLLQTDHEICIETVRDKVIEFVGECTSFVWDVKTQPSLMTFSVGDRTYDPRRHRRIYAANSSSDIIQYHVWPTFVDESVNNVLFKGYVVT